MKRLNLDGDRAEWQTWQTWVRTPNQDLYVTVLRRSYIPPMMEMYQDITVISRYEFGDDEEPKENDKRSQEFLNTVH